MQEILDKKRVYSSPWINIEKVDLKLPSGKIIEHNLVDANNNSVAAVVKKDNKLLLIKNFRFASNESKWEIPGGWMESGETAQDAVIRKVEHETGYEVQKIERLGEGKPWVGISNKDHYYFLVDIANKLDKRDQDFVENTRLFSFNKIEGMIKKGDITDQSTITGLYLAKLHKDL
ncbi:MAG: NUDIX hydrolase [archaeon]